MQCQKERGAVGAFFRAPPHIFSVFDHFPETESSPTSTLGLPKQDAPGKPKLAEDGAAVKAGQSVCVVEAMKLFNPIKAPASGKITFLVEHGKGVQKGQVLATIG